MEEKSPLTNINLLIERIAFGVSLLFVFAAPLFFLPLMAANVFDFPKWMFIIVSAALMLILSGVYAVVEKKLSVPIKQYSLPLSLFGIAFVVSILFSSTHRFTALYGKTGIIIGLILISLSILVLVRQKTKYLFYSLVASGVVLSLIQILSFLEILPKVLKSPLFSQKAFTPLGSQTTLAAFLIIMLPVTLLYAFKNKNIIHKAAGFVVSGIQTLALIFTVSQILPGQPASPKFLPFPSGWSVALDQLKNAKTAIFGVGPDNFSLAFSQFRPALLNQGDSWFVRFGASSNEFLTIFSTLGVIGLVTFVLLVITFLKAASVNKDKSLIATAASLGLVITTILLFVIPANFSVLFLFFILGIIVVSAGRETLLNYSHPFISNVSGIAMVIIPVVICVLFLAPAAIAESAFGQSLKFASQNRGAETYNKQIEAIKYNPYLPNYRITYSNTNLALANSLASKKDLTDEDKGKITQLVAQSIREAKAAVALDPQNPVNWINLAQIYRQLINFAQGSDQWAISSYVQAVRLDSTNPQLRLDLGGLLYSLNNYEEAIDQFKQAIALKPDYANAYYNLSYAYRQMKQYPQAYAAMQNVVSLLDVNNADHEKAVGELTQLQALLPQDAKQATVAAQRRSSELTQPQPTPSPNPAGELTFDQQEQKELEPPIEENTQGGTEQEATPSATTTTTP